MFKVNTSSESMGIYCYRHGCAKTETPKRMLNTLNIQRWLLHGQGLPAGKAGKDAHLRMFDELEKSAAQAEATPTVVIVCPVRHEHEQRGSSVGVPRFLQKGRTWLSRRKPSPGLSHDSDALLLQEADRAPETTRERSTRRVPQPAARGLEASPSEVAPAGKATDVQRLLTADLVKG